MAQTKAWMLNKSGVAVEVPVHLYVVDDMTECADAGIFIYKYGSDRKKAVAMNLIDGWLALELEQILRYNEHIGVDIIEKILGSMGCHFAYNISAQELFEIHEKCQNYSNIDTLYEYCDSLNEEELVQQAKDLLNNEFCRVRYGGELDATKGQENTMWYRIGSKHFNWSDVIYMHVSDNKNKYQIRYVTICRDAESDYGFDNADSDTQFYRAKDGTEYYMMPVQEFLSGMHESNPVFEKKNRRTRRR